MSHWNSLRCTAWICAAALIAACGTIDERKLDYKNAERAPALEVPPDLLGPAAEDELSAATAPLEQARATSSEPTEATGGGTEVGLPAGGPAKIAADDGLYWLELSGAPEQWWEPVQNFFRENGFEIKRADAKLGLIETGWSENRGDIPVTSIFRKAFDALYSASTRDKFIVHVESGTEPQATRVVVSHRGMEEKTDESDNVRWFPRQREPALELEMIKGMALAFGGDESEVDRMAEAVQEAKPLAELQVGDNAVALAVPYDFSRAWRRVGLALDRAGLVIEDYNRDEHFYLVSGFVPEKKEQGFFSSFFSSQDPEAEQIKVYRLDLNQGEDSSQVRVVAQQEDGAGLEAELAEQLLGRIRDALNNNQG